MSILIKNGTILNASDIYRGVIPFIILQLIMLLVLAYWWRSTGLARSRSSNALASISG